MGRTLRFIPEGGALVEVTCRTIHGRFLFRPSRELNDIVVGRYAPGRPVYISISVDGAAPVIKRTGVRVRGEVKKRLEK